MTAVDVGVWIPEEWKGPVIQKVMQGSAIEENSRIEPMNTDTLHVPRSGEFGVSAINKSGTYTEDTSAVGQITLTARKLGKAMRIAEEDKADTAQLINVIATKKLDWARNYAKYLDNACLGVTAISDNDMLNGKPFNSLYYCLKVGLGSLGTDYADVSYTPAANVVTASATQFGNVSGTTSPNGYTKLLDVLSIIEEGDYYDEGEIVVVAHPKFKRLFRGVVGNDGHPVIVEDAGEVPTIGGYKAKWSLGARTSPTASATPAGNPLLFVYNRRVATVLGRRSGPETLAASASSGAAGFLTDEDLIKMRSRRGFAVGDPNAAAVLEYTG